MTFVQVLLNLVGPVLVRALAYLGIVAATVTGVDTAFGALLAATKADYDAMPPTVLALAGLAGIPQALGIIWGAWNARLALWIALASTRWIVAR